LGTHRDREITVTASGVGESLTSTVTEVSTTRTGAYTKDENGNTTWSETTTTNTTETVLDYEGKQISSSQKSQSVTNVFELDLKTEYVSILSVQTETVLTVGKKVSETRNAVDPVAKSQEFNAIVKATSGLLKSSSRAFNEFSNS